MSAPPQKPLEDPKKIMKLLETGYTAQEAWEILAARIVLARDEPREPQPSSRVSTGSQQVKITETDLQQIRTGRFRRMQLPSEEEARYWLQQWREGAKPKEEPPIRKIVIRRDQNEVRE